MAAGEWDFIKSKSDQAALVTTVAAQVKTFEPGTTVLPGFNAIAVNGHTPGHMSYEIVSGKDRLLDIGDVRAQFDPLTRQT
jgi:glyoxylase-like metal-dependent hydrolase (beta-lactamase superfamily II)